MHQYQINCAFHSTKLNDFLKAVKAIDRAEHKDFFRELQDYFKADLNWQPNESSEFSIDKLLDSNLFKDGMQ